MRHIFDAKEPRLWTLPIAPAVGRPVAVSALAALSLSLGCASEGDLASTSMRFPPVQDEHPADLPDTGIAYLGVFAGPLGEFGTFEANLKATGDEPSVLAGELRTGDGGRYWPAIGRFSLSQFPRLEFAGGPYRLGLGHVLSGRDAFREVPAGLYSGPAGLGSFAAVRRDHGTEIFCGWTVGREFPVMLVVNSAGHVGGVSGGPRRGEAWHAAGRASGAAFSAGLINSDEVVGHIEGSSAVGTSDGLEFTARAEDCP